MLQEIKRLNVIHFERDVTLLFYFLRAHITYHHNIISGVPISVGYNIIYFVVEHILCAFSSNKRIWPVFILIYFFSHNYF